MANASNLVIVESPSKAKTIGKYLGPDYVVKASMGHLRDLPKSKMGVDLENDFTPQYIAVRGKESLIKELKADAAKADTVGGGILAAQTVFTFNYYGNIFVYKYLRLNKTVLRRAGIEYGVIVLYHIEIVEYKDFGVFEIRVGEVFAFLKKLHRAAVDHHIFAAAL